ncbi:MAG TPA: amylo-alpha-1,6-glucosidase [Anaeromyxobacter sp.]
MSARAPADRSLEIRGGLVPPPPGSPLRADRGPELRAPPPIVVGREACQDYARSSRLEWLETNGLGGFAMGTVSGAPTRRYHGLLVAALRPPVERHLLVAGLHEAIVSGGEEHPLFVTQYPGALHPQGWRSIAEFRLDPFPTWTFEAGGVRLEKRLLLVHGEDTALVRYRASGACRLRIGVFVAFRDHHALTHRNPGLDGAAREDGSSIRLRPYAGLPELRIHHGGARVERGGDWYLNVEYQRELERGLDFREDLWRACTLEVDLPTGGETFLAATLGDRRVDAGEAAALERAERERRRTPYADPLTARLSIAADQFLASRSDGSTTVIAGYPWFTDWGRDTMISVPGLLVARGRLEEARDVVRGFLRHLDRGLVPNRFPDVGSAPEYDTVDATLWLFQAVHAIERASPDVGFLAEVHPALREILSWHVRGTHHGIRVDPADGLLVAGDAGTQLTWMDARVGERVVTPRHGKPVEVNALWYNALRLAERWAGALGHREEAAAHAAMAERAAAAFDAAFWDAERGHLADVIRPDGVDRRLRPNQLLAASLPFPLLDPVRRRAVVSAAERALLTPLGLRTLAPGEPGYEPRYRGGPGERDGAYHQGVVWPWLVGPFVRARLAAFGRTRENLDRCRAIVSSFASHLEDACLGQVSEILEAEEPYLPGGAPAQAWSVAALLETLLVDLAERG